MTNYESLGIRPIINASATLTKLGGSLMPPEVVQAMHDAAQCFIDLPELQVQVGDKIAELTNNEAAYISSGAAAGLVLATAVCVTDCDTSLINKFPFIEDLKNEIIIQHNHRNGYDYAVQQVGIKIVEIGDDNGASGDDLRNAITPKTAAIFWFQGNMTTDIDIPMSEVIAIADEHNVPVIVDGAAQVPPMENLWKWTQMGATLAIFSGGKDLRGPQSSGLVLGKRRYVEAMRSHGSPNQAIGRPMKVGKEEMMGLLAAVERYLKLDHVARSQYCETTVSDWCEAFSTLEGVTVERDFPNEAGQPLAWCLVTLDSEKTGITRDGVIQALLDGTPSIAVALGGDDTQLHLNPMTLEEGQEKIVEDRFVEVIEQASK
jgi:uncharacterized pyridoxal phosphate-dependent enzyme